MAHSFRTSVRFVAAVGLALLSLAATPSFAGENFRNIAWAETVVNLGLRGHDGERFAFTCPANQSYAYSVWGTDYYTDDSAICAAAIHAGIISNQGGSGVLQIAPGRGSYNGTSRNGINTRDYGAWHGSYVFTGGGGASSGGGAFSGGGAANSRSIAWAETPVNLGLRGRNGERFAFTCPANQSYAYSVWGTDYYTDDSAICAAAIHASIISNGGGSGALQIAPGRGSYQGTSRNGINTRDYGAWHGSYVFVR
jgi:hypothetical protein